MSTRALNKDWTPVRRSTALAVLLILAGAYATPAHAADGCTREAIDLLKRYSPTGYDAYQTNQD